MISEGTSSPITTYMDVRTIVDLNGNIYYDKTIHTRRPKVVRKAEKLKKDELKDTDYSAKNTKKKKEKKDKKDEKKRRRQESTCNRRHCCWCGWVITMQKRTKKQKLLSKRT